MNRRLVCLVCMAVVFAGFAGTLIAGEKNEKMLQAKVVSVKTYQHGKIAYWEGRVAIYDNRAVYDITLDVGGKKQIVRYEPTAGFYPNSWTEGSEIMVKRRGKNFILMYRQEEVELRTVSENDCVPDNGPPTVVTLAPNVPCS